MINEIRLTITDFLNRVILDNSLLFFNYWHIIHFSSGIILMALLIKFLKNSLRKSKFFYLFILLILWEIFEFVQILVFGSKGFLIETRLDVFYDVVAGILGGWFFLYIKESKFFRE